MDSGSSAPKALKAALVHSRGAVFHQLPAKTKAEDRAGLVLGQDGARPLIVAHVQVKPPICFSAADVDRMVAALEAVLSQELVVGVGRAGRAERLPKRTGREGEGA